MSLPVRRLLPALLPALLLVPAGPAVAEEGHEVREAVAATDDTAPDLRLRGGGWGHGVGMSQYGAYAMARDGREVREILNTYYEGTHLAELDDLDGVADGPVHVGLRDGAERTSVEVDPDEGPAVWRTCDDGACETVAEQDEGTWHVTATDDGLLLEADDPDASVPAGIDVASELRLEADTRFETEVDRADGTQVTRTMRRGVHRVLDITAESEDEAPALSTVQVLDGLEAYARGLAEMPSSWGAHGGQAALEAQAVAGRTYAADRIRPGSSPGDAVCRCHLQADAGDQVYAGWDKESETSSGTALGELWVDAVTATDGEVLAHGGELAEALYSSSHHGRTENVEDSWAFLGADRVDYLRSVDDPWSQRPDVGNPYRSWTATVAAADVVTELSPGVDDDLAVIERLRVADRTEGGTPRTLDVVGRDADGGEVTGTYTGTEPDEAPIALAALRTRLDDVTVVDADGDTADLDTLPSSQVDAIGFAPFVDDEGRVHEHATAWAFEAGVAHGVADDRFAPRRSVTRGQLATFLHRTFDVPVADEQPFDDVGDGHEHAEAISALGAAGIADGLDGDRFAPGSSVTREQMASLLTRTLALDGAASDEGFADLRGGVHDDAIRALAALGVTEGCDADRFCPDQTVPREQMATFIHRAVRSQG